MKWIVLCVLIVPIFADLNQNKIIYLTVNDSESLNGAFNFMTSCFMSTNYSTSQCNSSDRNQCNNPLICCETLQVCYSSINVVFMSGIHTLQENYTFENLQNVRFSGNITGQPSIIKCITENNDFATNSGIAFIQVKNLTIENLNIIGCGMKHLSTSTSNNGEFITHLSAIYIQNSTNILLSSVNISNSNATGLSIVDTNGTISITNSFFTANRITIPAELSTVISGGGGIYIEYTACAPGVHNCISSDYAFANNSIINVENCVFDQNHADYNFTGSLTANLDNRTYIGFGAGGGLSLQFNGHAKDVFIHTSVVASNFSNNKADNGGGLSFYARYNTSYVHLNISKCTFLNNSATYFGGGGIVIGFVIFNAHERIVRNTIIIDSCSFERNRSPVVGGGLSWHGATEILGTRQTNHFAVSRCSFTYNQALYGSAIQINKEYFDLIANGTFLNLEVQSCNFTYNSANILLTSASGGSSGVGVVSASKVNLQFSGYTEFSSNNSTALVGDEAELGFHNHSVTAFHDNRGFLGGAVLLMSSSWMNMHSNSTLVFLRNVAVINGGAIYVHFATLFDYLISYSCFVRYLGQNIAIDEWNTQLIFIDNKAADNQTNSIFTTTLRPCQNTYSRDFLNKQPFCFYSSTTKESNEPVNISKSVDHLLDGQYCMYDIQGQISTASARFCNVSNEIVYVVPGKVHDLNVCIFDELDNQIINAQFVATCVNSCTNTCPDPSISSSESFSNMPYVLPAYRTSNGSIQIGGTPGSTCQLQLQTIEDFQITGAWSLELLNCPPGYFQNSKDDVCTCLAERENPVIPGCEETVFQAYFDRYYWIGYKSDDATDLIVGPCPYQYCYEDYDVTGNELLPETANKSILDRFVCGGSYRTGTLCGRCIDGYSVTLNSPTFACNKCDDEYKLGVLFLFLSYILPVTILFVIIMMFDIRITTGPIGSFIFFAQIISSEYHYILIYSINANNPTTLKIFNAILGVYSVANLDFFNHDAFKYCIFQRAGTIDIVAFELLLSLYPVVLIITYALIRKYYYVCKWSWCFSRFSISSKSITHGICAFLVICFAKINLQAFTILIPGELTFIDDIDHTYKTLVYLQGDLEYFTEMPHTLYALGAILFIIIVIAIPTLILLFHPIMMRIAVYFQWGESRIVLFINQCLMIDRLKPVLDSFQGNYKDNLHCFAGLQIFFYRTLFFLIVVVTTPDIDKSLLFITSYFVAILLIHYLAMPFKKYIDNMVYSMIYVLLLTISIIELYTIISGMFFEAVIWMQIILCLLPLCCFVLYYSWRLIQIVRKVLRKFQTEKILEVSYIIASYCTLCPNSSLQE